jgi:uncharacterized membrane protein
VAVAEILVLRRCLFVAVIGMKVFLIAFAAAVVFVESLSPFRVFAFGLECFLDLLGDLQSVFVDFFDIICPVFFIHSVIF